MKRTLLIGLVILLAVAPAGAQDELSCTAEDIGGALDSIETALASAREAVDGGDLAGAVDLLGQIAEEAEAGQAVCTSAGGQAVDPSAPLGSISNPIPLGEMVATQDFMERPGSIQINSVEADANALVQEQNEYNPDPEDGFMYVAVNLTIHCDMAIGEICEPHYFFTNLKVGGTSGSLYQKTFVMLRDDVPAELMGGGEATGYIVYSIPKSEEGLFLLYNPDRNTRIFFATE